MLLLVIGDRGAHEPQRGEINFDCSEVIAGTDADTATVFAYWGFDAHWEGINLHKFTHCKIMCRSDDYATTSL